MSYNQTGQCERQGLPGLTPQGRREKGESKEALAAEPAVRADASVALRVEGIEERAEDEGVGPDCMAIV